MDDLALKVAVLDDIRIDDADRPNSSCGEIHKCRGAEATGPDRQDLGIEKLLLPGDAHFRQQDVPRVAVPLLGGHDLWDGVVEPEVLPAGEPTVHRVNVGVPELLEGARRKGASH